MWGKKKKKKSRDNKAYIREERVLEIKKPVFELRSELVEYAKAKIWLIKWTEPLYICFNVRERGTTEFVGTLSVLLIIGPHPDVVNSKKHGHSRDHKTEYEELCWLVD